MRRYRFRVPFGERALRLEAGSSSLAKAAAKVSHRLGMPEGARFVGFSVDEQSWMGFEVGRNPRMIHQLGRVG